jgi:hypothetical protein
LDSISGSEIASELNILLNKMKSRRDENFCTTKLNTIIRFEDVYSTEQFTKVTNSFCDTSLQSSHVIPYFRTFAVERVSLYSLRIYQLMLNTSICLM